MNNYDFYVLIQGTCKHGKIFNRCELIYRSKRTCIVMAEFVAKISGQKKIDDYLWYNHETDEFTAIVGKYILDKHWDYHEEES